MIKPNKKYKSIQGACFYSLYVLYGKFQKLSFTGNRNTITLAVKRGKEIASLCEKQRLVMTIFLNLRT